MATVETIRGRATRVNQYGKDASAVLGAVEDALAQIGAEKVYGTVDLMKADTELVAGARVRTLGYYASRDRGAASYDIVTPATFGSTPDGLGDHLLANGLVARLDVAGNVFVAEKWGVADDVECSARIQACNEAALLRNVADDIATVLIMTTSPTAKNQIVLGGSGADRFEVDFSGCIIKAVTGGNLSLTTPLIKVNIKNSVVELPNLQLEKLCPGFWYENCAGAELRNGAAERFIGYGHKQSGGSSGNSVIYNPSGVEWKQSDPEFNIQANFLYDTVIIDCADSKMVGGRIGQAKRNIYLGSSAVNTMIIGSHPFNGNPNFDEPGVVLRTNAVNLESDAQGKVYAIDCYFDNGYIYDNSSRLNIIGGRHLVLLDRVDMTRPYVRVVAGDDASDDRFTTYGIRDSIGFYEVDHTTEDPNYTWLNANPTLLLRAGSVTNTGGQFNHIVTTTNLEPHFTVVKRGTDVVWERMVTNQGTVAPDDIIDIYYGAGLIKSNAAFTSTGARPLGYGEGAGGTVTQATSRTTAVTINKPCGEIVLVSAAGSTTPATFRVNNTSVSALDSVIVAARNGTNVYLTAVTAVRADSFDITFWTTGGTATDAPTFNFAIINGQNS